AITVTGTAAGNTLTTTLGGLSADLSPYHENIKDVIIGGSEQPAAGVLFAISRLTASSNEDLKVTEIKFNVEGSIVADDDFGKDSPFGFWLAEATGENIWGSHLNGLTFAKTENLITVTGNPITTVTKGTSKHIVIGGTPLTSATTGREGKIVVESGWIKATGSTSAKTISASGNVNYNSGDTLTLRAGLLNSAVNASSPSAQTFLKGQPGITIAKFDLKSAKSSNNKEIEDIKISRIEVYLSNDTSSFANTKALVLADDGVTTYTITRDTASSTANTSVFIPASTSPANTVTLTRDGSAKTITIVSDVTAGASGKVYARLVSTGTRGAGVTSKKDIVCSSSDQTAAEHTIGSSQMTLSYNSSTSNPSQFEDVSGSSEKLIIGANLNVDNNENVTITASSKIKIKLDGSVDKMAITELKVKAGAPSFSTTWLSVSGTPFNNSTKTYDGSFTGAALPFTITKNTTTQFRVYLKIDASKVADGDTLILTILDGSISAVGAISTQSI
ncbi:MAG TPA: hypothetical protein PKW98_18465, partial [Candidatus Wallbacteria bacterium]|nr:hypothetical protein [Candidatus Wallbacteria bacterium]